MKQLGWRLIGSLRWPLVVAGWLIALIGLFMGISSGTSLADETAAPPLTFEDDIVPILTAHCFKCHGGTLQKAGLDLRRRFAIVTGGDSGAGIVPGKPDESLLIEMIEAGQMPPEGEKRLSPQAVQTLAAWIAAGAATRQEQEAPLPLGQAVSAVSPEDRNFWAFRVPRRPEVPVLADASVRTPIDAFLLARLHAVGGKFNPDAPRETLLRRLTFDLHGLPPAPEELDAFLADDRPDAYEREVDRLLDSPRYGERWGRHWLDVAGYADSDGYLEADRLRPEAWRYRDYVIRALNDDKPFDRFVLEQLAGDELLDWRRAAEITPEMTDALVATGFLRTAADPTYGNYAEPLECHKVLADTMQIVGSAFLGLTIQCARCHDHPSDPLPQRDYYRLQAVFLTSYNPDRWQVSLARSIPLATEAQQARIQERNAQVDARLKQLLATAMDVAARYRDRFLDESLASIADQAQRERIRAALLVDETKRNAEQKALVAGLKPEMLPTEANLGQRFPEFQDEARRLRAAIDAETALRQTIVPLRALHDLDGPPPAAHVLIRGDFNHPGREVEPGLPTVLTPAEYEFQPVPGYKTSGRRLALARWLVDSNNPLTARVHVNRIWAQRFGRGLVSTVDRFGRAGEFPSHPELLDWLAAEFMASGWSQKHLHRLMLTSTAFRQSSQPAEWQQTSDPENQLLGSWRPLRHEGEVVRDSMLALGGKLNPQMFGPPVPVNRNSEGLVTVADTADGNRRSIYVIVRRSQPVTLLELFDTPKMEVNCPQRAESVVVTQSLSLLNSEFVESGAKALAARVLDQASDADGRLDLVYRLLYSRYPRETERRAVSEFLGRVEQALPGEAATRQRQAWEQLCVVLLNANELLFVH